MPDLDGVDLAADHALIIGCGTAHYAGRVGEYWLEQIAGIAVETDIASEFRYRKPAFGKGLRGVRIAIRRNRRHAGGAALLQATGPQDAGRRQRARKHNLARGRCAPADLGRPRDRRRLDQGVHSPAFGAGGAGDRRGARARGTLSAQEEAPPRACADGSAPADRRGAARPNPESKPSPRNSPAPATCSISAAAFIIRWRSKAR